MSDKTNTDPIFVKDTDMSLSTLLQNDYSKSLTIPMQFKQHILERLLYEVQYLRAKRELLKYKKIPMIPNLLLFQKESHEFFYVVKSSDISTEKEE